MTAGDVVTFGPWEYGEPDGWKHCGRVAWVNDDGVTCSRCQAFTSWDDDGDDDGLPVLVVES
jgi:hypothetical protein